MSKKLSRRSFMQKAAQLAASLSLTSQIKLPETVETEPQKVDGEFIPVDNLDKEGQLVDMSWSPYHSMPFASIQYLPEQDIVAFIPSLGRKEMDCNKPDWVECQYCDFKDCYSNCNPLFDTKDE